LSVQLIPAQEATQRWSQALSAKPAEPLSSSDAPLTNQGAAKAPLPFDLIIDVRSEGEFALEHWPGAVNWPVLNNDERILVGTLYKQTSAFEAKKKGAALVAANIAKHIERHVLDQPKSWQPLIYCWRGGNRSGSLSLVLSQIGFKVHLLEGGYKAFRHQVMQDLESLITPFRFEVIAGPTGSGKTRLLQTLKTQGAQVLDLEGLAHHKSSVLGFTPNQPQPSQKHFDTLIWEQFHHMDPSRVVYIESESKKVGNLSVPQALIDAMRASPCHVVDLPLPARVSLLIEDYPHLVEDPVLFQKKLQALSPIRGQEMVNHWCTLISQGRIPEVVESLLINHYDPTYFSSMKKNFKQLPSALVHELKGHEIPHFQALSQTIMSQAKRGA